MFLRGLLGRESASPATESWTSFCPMSNVAKVQHEMPHLQPMPNNYEEILWDGRFQKDACRTGRLVLRKRCFMTAVSVFGLLFSSCDIDIRNCNALTGEEPASLLPLLAAIEGRIAEYCRNLAVENSSCVELTVQNRLF